MVETFFTEKRIIKKIIIVLIFIFMFNFTFTYLGNNMVFAESGSATTTTVEDDVELEDGGGKLLLPIHKLIIWITDAILELMQNSLYSPDPIIQKARSEDMSDVDVASIVICIVAVAVCVVAIVYTGGAVLGAAGAYSAASAGATAAGASSVAAALVGAKAVIGSIARRISCSWS